MDGDHRLLTRAAGGDGDAFAQLVSPHRAELLGFARRILDGDGQAGEEVVQEALLNAYRALVRGARPDSIRPWLFVIVRNCALNARRQAQTTYLLGDGDGARSGDTPNEAAEQGEWIDWLMGAIGELPARQRQAIVGRELEGRSHVELASSLGTTVLAVKTLLHRARARLRALRAESMLSVPVFVKGRVEAGVKAGGGVLGQSLAAASVTTLVVLAVHGGGAAPVGAAGLTVHGSRASAARRSGGATRSTADRPPSAVRVRREATRAIAGCVHGRPLKGFSQQALNYAAGHLSADELEYTDCEVRLRRAARAVALPPGASARTVSFAQPPAGVNVGGGRRDRLLVRPSTVVIYPHGWLVTGLRWSGWGTATAHASGWSLESSKNLTTACEPHCSGGTFERSPAGVALWSPGPFDGQTVYRCFRVSDRGSAPDVPSAEGACSTGARVAPGTPP